MRSVSRMSLKGSMVGLANSKRQTANSQTVGRRRRTLVYQWPEPSKSPGTFLLFTVHCLLSAQNKTSRAKQRGTSLMPEVFGSFSANLSELFSRLFYVAASRLNSPRFPFVLIRPHPRECQADNLQVLLAN